MSVESATEFLKCLQDDSQFRDTLADKLLVIEQKAQEQAQAEIKAAGYDFTPEELAQVQELQMERAGALARVLPDTQIGIMTKMGILGAGGTLAKPWPYGAIILFGRVGNI